MEFSPKADTRVDAAACGHDLLEGPGDRVAVSALGAEGESRGRALARLLGSAAVPFVVVDGGDRIVCLNRAFADLAGAGADELLARPYSEVTPPDGRDAQAETFGRIRATARPARFDAECLRHDGGVVPVEVFGANPKMT